MIRYLFFLLACATCGAVFAQTQSDVSVSEGGYGIVNSNISVQYDHTWGQVSDRLMARAAYKVFSNRRWSLTANARLSSITADFDNGALTDGFNPDEIGLNSTHMMGQVGVTANTRARVFGKPFMGIAMLNSDWGVGGFERISATMMGVFMLRYNRNTQFGIGPLVMLNTTSKIPAFLIFMYRHRFDEKLQLNLYGGMFWLDYNPVRNTLLSIGADIDVKSFYFRPHSETLPDRCRLTLTSFRPTVKLRQRLAGNFYFDAQAGVSLKMSCRVNGRTGTKEYFKCHQKAAPFVQCGMSYSL